MPETLQRRRLEGDTVHLAQQFRDATFERASVNLENRTVELTFSSEEPYERWWGTEVLAHDGDSVNLERLNNGGALLLNHDWRDQVGVIEKAWVKDNRGHAIVRFSRSAKGAEILQDVQDGIRSLVSVGYSIDEMRLESVKDDNETYRIERWTPYEISLVAVPADPTVGVGREAEQGPMYAVRVHRPADVATPPKGTSTERSKTMTVQVEENAPAGAAAEQQQGDRFSAEHIAKMVTQKHMDFAKAAEDNEIESRHVRDWIERGLNYDQVGDEIVKILAERGKDQKHSRGWLGLSRNETEDYSVLRAISAMCEGTWKNAGLELEAHRALADKLGKTNLGERSLLVPADVLKRGVKREQRDLTVATASAGGYLVETANMGFVDLLRNRSVAMNMGVTRLSGMSGNVSIPRQTAAGTAYWLANEATAITESQLTLGQIALTPKTVGAYTEVSRLLMLQSSPDAEGLVLSDLAQVVGLAADLAILQGSGASGQPTGLSNTSGVGSVTGTSIAYAGILEFQTDVAAGNALFPNSGYVTTPAVAALLMQRQRFSSTDTPLWEGNVLDGRVAGFRAMSTNQSASATIYFGNWPAIVLAEWGVLELDINNAANFPAGIVGLRAMYTMDVGVRYPGAFSIATSVT